MTKDNEDQSPSKPNGQWPTGTWFQLRLAKLKLKEAKEVLNVAPSN